MLLAMVILIITSIVSSEVAENVLVRVFRTTCACTIVSSLLWLALGKLFPPIFDYFVFKFGDKICFAAADGTRCYYIEITSKFLKYSNEEIGFKLGEQVIKIKCDKNVIKYLKELGADFQ